MSYQEFKPSHQLSDIVDCYWTSNDQKPGVNRVLPDGCADLIFNFGSAVINVADNQVSVSKESIAAVGMMTTYRDVTAVSGADLLGVRLKTGSLSLFTNTSLGELKNITIQANEIMPELNNSFLEELHNTIRIEHRIFKIEKILNNLLENSQITGDPLISSVTDLILKSQGQIRVEDIAHSACISLRQLQRRFKTRVGTSLKEYAKIIRFINTSRMIKHSPDKSILEISFESGYYDHSHLHNDFKQLSGMSPSAIK